MTLRSASCALELHYELVDHAVDRLAGQRPEGDHRVETIAEFRREQFVDRFRIVALAPGAGETVGLLRHIRRAGIRGHDQNDVTEIDLLAVCDP